MIVTFKEIMELRKIDKAKAYDVAKSVYRVKGGVWASRAYAWTLCDRISMEIPTNGYVGAEPYIDKFLKLGLAATFIMNNFFLLQMEKLYDDSRCPMFEILRDRCFFMEEDWERKRANGVVYPSTAESFVSKFITVLEKQSNACHFWHFKPFLENACKRIGDNTLFCYNFGKLLGAHTKEYDRALELMIPMAKVNSGAYWVWEALAEVYDSKKHYREALSFYCKALSCYTEEKYLTDVKYNLGMLFHRMEMDGEAKTEILEMMEILRKEGRFAICSRAGVKEKQWFVNATPKPSNKALYQKHKKLAEKIVAEW